MYDLEDGEPSVFEKESKASAVPVAKSGRQVSCCGGLRQWC